MIFSVQLFRIHEMLNAVIKEQKVIHSKARCIKTTSGLILKFTSFYFLLPSVAIDGMFHIAAMKICRSVLTWKSTGGKKGHKNVTYKQGTQMWNVLYHLYCFSWQKIKSNTGPKLVFQRRLGVNFGGKLSSPKIQGYYFYFYIYISFHLGKKVTMEYLLSIG